MKKPINCKNCGRLKWWKREVERLLAMFDDNFHGYCARLDGKPCDGSKSDEWVSGWWSADADAKRNALIKQLKKENKELKAAAYLPTAAWYAKYQAAQLKRKAKRGAAMRQQKGKGKR
jgi:hypothetical protein